jgi:hypothetical protein
LHLEKQRRGSNFQKFAGVQQGLRAKAKLCFRHQKTEKRVIATGRQSGANEKLEKFVTRKHATPKVL